MPASSAALIEAHATSKIRRTNDLLTVPEAARLVGLDPSRVRTFCVSGLLPATKVGRDWLVKGSDVVRFARKPRKPGRPFGWNEPAN